MRKFNRVFFLIILLAFAYYPDLWAETINLVIEEKRIILSKTEETQKEEVSEYIYSEFEYENINNHEKKNKREKLTIPKDIQDRNLNEFEPKWHPVIIDFKMYLRHELEKKGYKIDQNSRIKVQLLLEPFLNEWTGKQMPRMINYSLYVDNVKVSSFEKRTLYGSKKIKKLILKDLKKHLEMVTK